MLRKHVFSFFTIKTQRVFNIEKKLTNVLLTVTCCSSLLYIGVRYCEYMT